MTVKEILALHPIPWRYTTIGGNVEVVDAAGVSVPLFTVLDLTTALTEMMAKKKV